jgi:hypothetical protein
MPVHVPHLQVVVRGVILHGPEVGSVLDLAVSAPYGAGLLTMIEAIQPLSLHVPLMFADATMALVGLVRVSTKGHETAQHHDALAPLCGAGL